MSMLSINGADGIIDKINSFSVEIFDFDSESSARNSKGDMLRDRITTKRKLLISYAPLKDAEISVVLKAISDEDFSVTYPDPMEGGLRTSTFYAGNRTAPVYFKTQEGYYLWKELSFALIEQ